MNTRFIFCPIIMIAILFSACSSSNISVSLASSAQKADKVSFYAKDYSKPDQLARFSQVRVYDITSGCQVPACPLMWHAVVSNTSSPTEIAYGMLPSFGAITMVSPKHLEANHQYRILLDSLAESAQRDIGSCDFIVEEDRTVTPQIE